MYLPGLSARQDRDLGEILRRLGRVTHGLFVDADVAGQRAMNPLRPSGDNVSHIAQRLSAAHDAPSESAGFAIGMAIGLRMGKHFQVATALRRIDEDYYRLDDSDRLEIRKLIRHLCAGGSFSVLTYDVRSNEPRDTPEEELADLREWCREAGKLARQMR